MQTLLLLMLLSFTLTLLLMPLVWVVAGRAMKIESPMLNYKSQFLNALLILVLLQIIPNSTYVTFLLKSGLKTTLWKAIILVVLGYAVFYLVGLFMTLVVLPMVFPGL